MEFGLGFVIGWTSVPSGFGLGILLWLVLGGMLDGSKGSWRRPVISPELAAAHAKYLLHLEKTRPKIGHSLTDAGRALAIMAILGAGVVVVLAPVYYFAGHY